MEKPKAGKPDLGDVLVGVILVGIADGLAYMAWLAIDGMRHASAWWAAVGLFLCAAFLTLAGWAWFGSIGVVVLRSAAARKAERERKDGAGGHDPAA